MRDERAGERLEISGGGRPHASRRAARRTRGRRAARGRRACCGSLGGASASAAAPKVKSGGALKVGTTGGGPSDSIDAHFATSDPDISRLWQLYEPLGVRDADFNFEYKLAESITPGKVPDVWTVKLRPGVTFHNGKPVTAEDVHLLAAADPQPEEAGHRRGVDRLRRHRQDARRSTRSTVQIALTIPNIGFPDDVGQYFNGIVPVGYNPKAPDRDRPVQVPELHRGTAERVRALPRLLGHSRRSSTR